MTARKRNSFIGTWRIVWMETWDQDYVDMEVPGHITFEKNGVGNFQFGLAQGGMDYRVNANRVDANRVEFTWSGFDEGDEMNGRGFAELENDELRGHFYLHLGDDSAFRAVGEKQKSP